MLDILVKNLIEKASKHNLCTHCWQIVMSGKGHAVLCLECGIVLCDNLLRNQAEKIVEIANNSGDSYVKMAKTN